MNEKYKDKSMLMAPLLTILSTKKQIGFSSQNGLEKRGAVKK